MSFVSRTIQIDFCWVMISRDGFKDIVWGHDIHIIKRLPGWGGEGEMDGPWSSFASKSLCSYF